MPGYDMGGLMAHDCSYLILGLEKLQQACVEHHLASRSNKGIHIAGLIDDRELPLQVLHTWRRILSATPMPDSSGQIPVA